VLERSESMATFHPFPRLPLEVRIQIWGYSTVESRVLRIRKLRARTVYWSPTPVPGITRACRESRRYCSYMKLFAVEEYPNYIWADLESDIIQMNGAFMNDLVTGQRLEKNKVRHLRVELVHDFGWDESESFFHDYSHKIRVFPKLQSCSILVNDGLYSWVQFVKQMYWGVCPQKNVQIVDAKTGEWINATTAGAYGDYVDTNYGATRDFIREDADWDEEDTEERYEEMMATMRESLQRLELVR
jgi:hypothetical protein